MKSQAQFEWEAPTDNMPCQRRADPGQIQLWKKLHIPSPVLSKLTSKLQAVKQLPISYFYAFHRQR
jgi:hypothetical protein